MPRQTEPNANNALGGLLQDMLPRSQVRSENTQAISGHPGLRPDIVVRRRLAAKWCAEPSVHGGKPRPKDAKLAS